MSVQDEMKDTRIVIKYKTKVEGRLKEQELPFRLLVLGDLSKGSSKDRRLDLEDRKNRSLDGSNLDSIMQDMGIALEMVIPNKINPDEESLRVKLSIDQMRSFSPEVIAKQVPQIRSLLLIKKLLEEIRSNISNQKEFEKLLNKLLSNKEALNNLKEKLKNYSMYKLPEPPKNQSKNKDIGEQKC